MARIFTVILNMSITASFAIGLVLLVRLFLRRCPKIYSYILWSVVLIRLLCPFALALPFIEMPFFSDATEPTGTNTSTMTYFSVDDERRQYELPEYSAPTHELPDGEHGAGADYSSGAVQSDDNNRPTAQAQPNAPVLPETVPALPQSRSSSETVFTVLGCIWAAGAAFFIGITAWQNISLRRRLAEAFILRDNIYESAYIDTAFVLGVIRPQIYLPKGLPDEVQRAIVTHEQTHQRRGDHIVKFVSYFALSIHWFNPLAWLSFKLMTADMESSCDEAVIRSLQKRGLAENRVKYAYSKMLVALGSGRLSILSPVSFAEGSIRARVENIAKSRRIRKTAAAAVGCVLVVALVIGIVNPFSVKAEGGEGDVGRSVVSGADTAEDDADASELSPEHEIFGVPHAPDAKLVKINGGYHWSDAKELNLAEAYDPDGSKYTEIDIAQLSEFSSLEALSICDLTIKNLSLLKGFPNLSKLTLKSTKNSDLSALGELTKLKSLTLGWGSVEDDWPNAVSKLVNLEYLDAEEIFADLHPLSRLPSLKTLITNVESQEALDGILSIKSLEALTVPILAQALGTDGFDETAFRERVAGIFITGLGKLAVHFKDGHIYEAEWENKRKVPKHTEERKEHMRQKMIENWRKRRGESNDHSGDDQPVHSDTD